MEINKNTGPLPALGTPEPLPAPLQSWLAQFPPEHRAALEQVYRQGLARGELPRGAVDPLLLLTANPAAGSKAIVALVELYLTLHTAQAEGRLESVARKFMSTVQSAVGLLQGEIDKALLRKLAAMAELAKEQARAAEFMRLFLEEEAIRGRLRQLKQQDVQVALENAKRQGLDLRQQDWKVESLSAIVATGLVAVVAAPVQAHSQLEGVTAATSLPRAAASDARSDERLTAMDHVSQLKRMAGDVPPPLR